MNRKMLEDFKINNRKVPETMVAPIVVKNVSNISTKYDFLKKKKSTPSFSQRIPQTPQMPGNKRPFNKIILSFFILSLFIGTFYLFTTVFFNAKITIIPKNQTFELKNEKFTASKKSSIPFEVMIVEDTLYKDVILTNSKEVSIKAKGEITLYNEYSKTTEKILAGTFISDESGKSYKIDNTVSVLGYTIDKNKKIIPGQVSVGITSFLVGEAYNGSPSLFSITSFKKGTDKYKKIYGHIKTPLAGGIAGLVYLVEDKEKESILAESSSFKDKLLVKLKALVPVGYVLYKDAVNFSYEFNDGVFSKTPNTKLAIKANLSAFLVKQVDLSESIIDKLLPDISKEERLEIMLPDISSLSFNFNNKEQIINKDIENFDFELTGKIMINWKPEVERLKGLIVGKSKDEVLSIFKKELGILSANVQIVPFWSKYLPDKKEKINIVLTNN